MNGDVTTDNECGRGKRSGSRGSGGSRSSIYKKGEKKFLNQNQNVEANKQN